MAGRFGNRRDVRGSGQTRTFNIAAAEERPFITVRVRFGCGRPARGVQSSNPIKVTVLPLRQMRQVGLCTPKRLSRHRGGTTGDAEQQIVQLLLRDAQQLSDTRDGET
jgi:hypothetical protein